MKRIVLFGAGGFGREVANLIEGINRLTPTYEILGFLDERVNKKNDTINGYPVLGGREWILKHSDVLCTCTIADVNTRARIQDDLSRNGITFETIVSANNHIPNSSVIGKGCVLYPDVKVSVNVTVADGVLLNTGTLIGHDVNIGKYTSIMTGTGISGGCMIGEKVAIGGHAFIVPGKKIGDRSVVAAGSIVFTNVRTGTTVLGNPAKRIRALEK